MLIRCSSLGKIMTEPQKKGELLSVGAKTYLKALAKEIVYGFRKEVDVKVLQKGRIVEDESIALYNKVFYRNLKKNSVRLDNGFITGECDLIIPGKRGIDIKSAWSLDTFPAFPEDCHDSGYEWQVRGYMALWDVPEWEIAYCMVSTPDELVYYEQPELHYVDHIDPHMRVTTLMYERDMEKEEKIKERVIVAREFLAESIARIKEIHGEEIAA